MNELEISILWATKKWLGVIKITPIFFVAGRDRVLPIPQTSSLLTLHSSLFTARSSLLTAHCSLLTPHCSLLAPHSSLLTAHCSLLTAHCSLLTAHCSLLAPHSSLLAPHSSLLTPHSSLLTPHSSLLANRNLSIHFVCLSVKFCNFFRFFVFFSLKIIIFVITNNGIIGILSINN